MGWHSRREFLKRSGAGMAAAGALTGRRADAVEQTEKRPNLVFVFPDQMRPHTMGFMNADPCQTPVLDRFARESLVLTDAVSTRPICSPYRASLMTGKYPSATGVPYNCYSASAHIGNELRADDRCISDVLSDAGYSLGYIGKWHLDAPHTPYVDTANNRKEPAWNEYCPPERRHGFDFWYAYGTYDNHFAPEYWVNAAPRGERKRVEEWSPRHETDMAMRYLKNEGGAYRDEDEPFALFVAHNPPHTPYQLVPEEYVARYAGQSPEDLLNRPNVPLGSDSGVVRRSKAQIKNYLAMVTGVDEQFGRLLATLDELGLAEDTIVVFTSDHGNCIGSHGHWTKGKFWEECYRVPFLIRWPGRIPARSDRLPLAPADITPTLLGLMGFGSEIPEGVQGANYAGVFRGENGPRSASALYMAMPYPITGDIGWGERGVRTATHTMVIKKMPGEAAETWLFENARDPYQLENLAEKEPGLVEKLAREELLPWLEKANDPWRDTAWRAMV